MEIITSTSNNWVQKIKKLNSKAEFRREEKQFVAEGYNLIKDIPQKAIIKLFVEEGFKKPIPQNCEVIIVSKTVMESMSDTKTACGILAVCGILKETTLSAGKCLVLDNLSDPGNVGTIIRTAVACDIADIILLGNCVDVYSPKVVRGSMGGVFKINFIIKEDLKKIDKPIYTLDMNGENLFNLKGEIAKNFALVVGSETHGVSESVKLLSNKIISLPMSGKMESLNAGVSISIALYHLIYGGY